MDMESFMKKDGLRVFKTLLKDYEENLKEGAFFVVNPKDLDNVLRHLENSNDIHSSNLLFALERLSLTQRSIESSTVKISFSKFNKLSELELRKVKISNLSLSDVKSQLRSLNCDGCDNEERLEGANHWVLESLAFRNRFWKPLKLDFLKSMPWLVELNLSRNNLKSCNLEHCKVLIHLNLNYNHLTEIPKLAEGIKIRTLLLSNNFISNLSGLENLEIKYLDLSYNIISISQINSISTLRELQYIDLKNNPFSVQLDKKYRVFMAFKIRSKHSMVKLDGEEITDAEKHRSRQKDEIEFFNKLLEKKGRIKPMITVESSEVIDSHIEEPQPIIIKVPQKIKTKEAFIANSHTETPNLKSVQNKAKKKIPKPKPIEVEDVIETVEEEKPLAGKYPVSCSSSPENNFVQSTVTAILHAPSTSKQYQYEESDEANLNEDKNTSLENTLNTTEEFHDESMNDVLEILNSISGEEANNIQENAETSESKNEDISIKEDLNTVSDENESSPKSKENEDKSFMSKINETIESNDENFGELNQDESFLSSHEDETVEVLNESENQDEDSFLSKPEDETVEVLKESEDESSGREEIWWHVKLYEKDTYKTKNVCIALLEKSLKEYNPKTGAVRRKWPLKNVQGCVKTKTDPITIEIDFECPNSGREQVCYIMEYADSQILMKTLYGILESKSHTQKCDICSNPLGSEICSVCGNFADKISKKSISHSPSESSIGSAISLDRPIKRCESDVETLSNPSLSSVEVIEDSSQSATPSRKKSSEERQMISSQLGTVHEVTVPLSTLTESSSSGSLTESVITAYDNTHSKKQIMTESLLEENESTDDNISIQNQADMTERNPVLSTKEDIYSFDDFSVVDERIKFYLSNEVFKNENESIIALVRCHLWKTGGSDYDGCFVLSNSSVYTFYHSRTDFSEPVCDWLSKADSYRIGDIKQISPLIHNQGVEIKINNIVYFLLLMDSLHTSNLLCFLTGLELKNIKNCHSFDLKFPQISVLQQAISGCELVRSSIDPTVNSFTIFKSIEIIKDKENEEFMRLGGIVVTAGEFYILPGDLSWIANCKPPHIHSYQEISRLIEVRRNKINSLSLYFLDEQEASEEVWTLTLTPSQIYTIIKSINGPWEKLYSVPLEITINYS